MRAPLLRLLSLALVAACAAPTAAAAGPATVEATVGGLALEGQIRVEGPLSALVSTGDYGIGRDVRDLPSQVASPGMRDTRVAPGALHLAARHLQVETDREVRSGSPLAATPQRSSASVGFDGAVASTRPARDGFQFYLAPFPGRAPPTARVEAVQAHLAPVAAGPAEPDRKVKTSRPSLTTPTGAAAVASGGLRTLHLDGDFVLSLWEWDLDVASAGVLVPSGYNYTAQAPTVDGVDTYGTSDSREVFVYAEGASLDLALPYDIAATLALQPAAASLDGRLVVEGVSGHLTTADGDRPLRDGDWVDGTFGAALDGLQSSSFHVRLSGTGRQASLSGLTLAIAVPAPSSAGPLMAVVAAAGAALLGTWRLWGRRPQSRGGSAPTEDDELRALRWLAERGRSAAVLWDSDLMRAFDWSAERAQAVLHALRDKGEVRCKDVALASDRSSLGHIALTAAGADRLRSGAMPPAGGGSIPWRGLRRIAILLHI